MRCNSHRLAQGAAARAPRTQGPRAQAALHQRCQRWHLPCALCGGARGELAHEANALPSSQLGVPDRTNVPASARSRVTNSDPATPPSATTTQAESGHEGSSLHFPRSEPIAIHLFIEGLGIDDRCRGACEPGQNRKRNQRREDGLHGEHLQLEQRCAQHYCCSSPLRRMMQRVANLRSDLKHKPSKSDGGWEHSSAFARARSPILRIRRPVPSGLLPIPGHCMPLDIWSLGAECS